MLNPFRPAIGGTVNLAATGTTSNVQISQTASPQDYRLYNAGTVPVFIREGGSSVTASLTTDTPIAPGAVEVLTLGATHVAGITAGTAATLYITLGDGI